MYRSTKILKLLALLVLVINCKLELLIYVGRSISPH